MTVAFIGPDAKAVAPYVLVDPAFEEEPVAETGYAVRITQAEGSYIEEQSMIVYRLDDEDPPNETAVSETPILADSSGVFHYTLVEDDEDADDLLFRITISRPSGTGPTKTVIRDLLLDSGPIIPPPDPADFPLPIPLADVTWSFVDETVDGVKVKVSIAQSVIDTATAGVTVGDFTLQFGRFTAPAVPSTAFSAPVVDGGATWEYTSGGRTTDGQTARLCLFWRRTADSANGYDGTAETNPYGSPFFAYTEMTYTAVTTPPPDPVEGFPDADQIVSSASALLTAINARVNATTPWIIDLVAGNYGALGWTNIGPTSPGGKITIRSQGLNYGATINPDSTLTNCRNMEFQFIMMDCTNSGVAQNAYGVNILGCDRINWKYCDFNAGPQVYHSSDTDQTKYQYRRLHAIRMTNNPSGGTWCTNCDVVMNTFRGPWGRPLYANCLNTGNLTDNVMYNIGCDDMMISLIYNVNIERNWGARVKFAQWSGVPSNPLDHSDFIQFSGLQYTCVNNRVIGNVTMVGVWLGSNASNHQQGIFGDQNNSCHNGLELRDNFICNNHTHGIALSGNPGTNSTTNQNVVIWNNATVHCTGDSNGATIDRWRSNQSANGISSFGELYISRTSEQGNMLGSPTDTLYVTMSQNNYNAGLTYYTNIARTSPGIYDARPVVGQPTHWDYVGSKRGPYQRFYDIIVSKVVPNIGRAPYYWALQYDPNGAIVSGIL